MTTNYNEMTTAQQNRLKGELSLNLVQVSKIDGSELVISPVGHCVGRALMHLREVRYTYTAIKRRYGDTTLASYKKQA